MPVTGASASRATSSSRWPRRPISSATTRSGPRRPTAPMPQPCWPGSPRTPSKAKIASGIFQMPARTPAMTAMTAATLDNISGGRFVLGLGISGPQVVEGWHGQPFDRPLERTREYVEIVRKALARETLTYDGEFYKLPRPGGPGQAAEADHPARAGPDPDLPRGDRAQEHGARRRDRRRLAADDLRPRPHRRVQACAWRRALASQGGRSTTSTSRR